MDEKERLHMLMTKTDTELCMAYNHVLLKPNTERQIEEILRSRKINKCDERSKVRLIPPDLTSLSKLVTSTQNEVKPNQVKEVAVDNNYGSPKTSSEFETKILQLLNKPKKSNVTCLNSIKGNLKFKGDNSHLLYGYQAICDVSVKFGISKVHDINYKKTPYFWQGNGEFTKVDELMLPQVEFQEINEDQHKHCKIDMDCGDNGFCWPSIGNEKECQVKSTSVDPLKTKEPVYETTKSSVSTTLIKDDFSNLESTCSNIGFKKGTEEFGDCVLELKKRAYPKK